MEGKHVVYLIGSTVAIIILIISLAIVSHQKNKVCNAETSTALMTTKSLMDKLWYDHVGYTRLFIISTIADSEDANAHAARLMKNQEDLGAAV